MAHAETTQLSSDYRLAKILIQITTDYYSRTASFTSKAIPSQSPQVTNSIMYATTQRTMECRICHNESPEETCSPSCSERLQGLKVERTWVSLALGEARASLTSFEAEQYGPLYIKYTRLSALHRALSLGLSAMEHAQQEESSSSGHREVHPEVQEWRDLQANEDKSNAPFIRKRLRTLNRQLSEIDVALSQNELDWETLHSKVASIERSLGQILKQTGDDPHQFDIGRDFTEPDD